MVKHGCVNPTMKTLLKGNPMGILFYNSSTFLLYKGNFTRKEVTESAKIVYWVSLINRSLCCCLKSCHIADL